MRQILDLELNTLREQEELQARPENLRREAKEIEKAGFQDELAGLQEDMKNQNCWKGSTNGASVEQLWV